MNRSAFHPARWGGWLAVVGIVLIALNLRTPVTSLTPIVAELGGDIPMDTVGIALIGMAPPMAFSLASLFSGPLARRLGLESSVLVTLAAMVLGLLVRALAVDYTMLLGGSVLALLGAGVGNILLPPLVKRYFPSRVGLMTGVYAALLGVSTALPAATAVPVAVALDWRVSLLQWAVLAAVALLPWLALVIAERSAGVADDVTDVAATSVRGVHRSRTAWAVTLTFATAALLSYSLFAWVPILLVDAGGVDAATAGLLVALFGVFGVPTSLGVVGLARVLGGMGRVVALGSVAYGLGYLGLGLAPAFSPLLWILLVGVGQLLFPAALVLINLRTRSGDGAVALSSLAQGWGYAVAALGPLVLGLLHEWTGSWMLPFALFGVLGLCAALLGPATGRPRFVEDEL